MKASISKKITKSFVDSATCPIGENEVRFWDSELKGFFIRIYPTGRKVYALKYRYANKQRIFTIGKHGEIAPDEARQSAKTILADLTKNIDAATEKKKFKEALTFKDLANEYFTIGRETETHKRESTWQGDERRIAVHILPQIGNLRIDDITKAIAQRTINAIKIGKTSKNEIGDKPRGRSIVTGGYGAANRTLATMNAMFNWGIKYLDIKENPFSICKAETPKPKERFLSPIEANLLIDSINTLEADNRLSRVFADAFRILLMTGARKSEIANLQWQEVDFENKLLRLPPERSKSGNKTGERRIYITPPVLEILSKRLSEHNDLIKANPEASNFVFKSDRTGQAIIGLRKAFKRITDHAKIDDLRIHDLRHSFASFAIADGASLYLVSKLLGHSSARVTERYAHLSDDPMQRAAEKVTNRFTKPKNEFEGGAEIIKPKVFE